MSNRALKLRRARRVHNKMRKLASAGQPRLSIFRSNQHIYAQIINDVEGVTLCSMSTISKDLRPKLESTTNMNAAEAVGKYLARAAKKVGVSKVVFDRGPYLYHGRIKALASGARAEGLEF